MCGKCPPKQRQLSLSKVGVCSLVVRSYRGNCSVVHDVCYSALEETFSKVRDLL